MRSSIILVAVAAALATSLSSCTDGPGQEAGAATESATEGSAAAPEPEAPPTDDAAAAFRPEIFGEDSATIDNEWWPLPVGSRFVWEGQAIEGEETVDRRVVFTVTDLTKVIHGVRTRVGWDRDYNDGVLGEGELIFLAQDTEGNVWHLGQYTEVHEDEEFVGSRLWVVGDPAGAQAGILMKAAPKLGDPSYSEGYAPPPWNWDDRAQVHETGVRTCVAVGCFDDVLVIEEFEPSKPDAQQLKYYARGVGTVRIGWAGEAEEEQEEMELVERVSLTPEELAEARAAALELEHRGYAYARTTPAELVP